MSDIKDPLTGWKWIDQRDKLNKDPLVYNNTKLEWGHPEEGKWLSSTYHRWTSVCGRYRVIRVVRHGSEIAYGSEYLKYTKFKHDNNGNRLATSFMSASWITTHTEVGFPGYPRYYKSLRGAIESVEQKHQEMTNETILDTNREEILAKAIRDGLEAGKTKPTEMVFVGKEKHRMESEQPSIQSIPKKLKEILDDNPNPSRIVKRTRVIQRDVDKFGSKIGSSKAIFNTAISDKPKTIQEIAKEAGITHTINMFYGHMKSLETNGFVKKVDGGFILVERN